jgi:hypothetical protein
LLGVVALFAVLAGCQVDANVDVTVREDGSGEVTVEVVLDEDAAARVPDLADDLRVRDLRATGWEVQGPTDTDDGGLRLTASKPFANVEQGRQVLREVGGRGGALRALVLAREHTFGTTTWRFGGRIDLSAGLSTFSDAELDEVLGAEAFGLDQASLEQQLGEPLAQTMRVTVTAHLPEGELTTDGEQAGDPPAVTWGASLGDEPVSMAAESEARDTKALTYAAVSVGALVLLVLLLVVRLIRRGLRRRRRRREEIPAA